MYTWFSIKFLESAGLFRIPQNTADHLVDLLLADP